MPDEVIAMPAATNGTPPPAPPAAKPTEKAPDKPVEAPKPPPTAEAWAKLNTAEKKAQERAQAAAKRQADLDARETALKAREAAQEAAKGDPAKLLEMIGGLDGYQKLTAQLLKDRGKRAAAGQPQTPQDVNAIVAKAIEDHEAKKIKAAEEAKAKTEAEQQKATEAMFTSLTKEASELVTNGGDRYEQIRAVVGKNPAHLNALLRDAHAALTSAEGWTVGGKTLRGETSLDSALDMLEDSLVERSISIVSAKVKARLSQAEKPAEQGGARKSETGGPSTLSSRLSQESTLTPRPASAADQPSESPLARKQREEAERLAETIAATEKLIKRQR